MALESSTPASPPTAPPVIDHRRMPPGVLPRHLQQWVLIGIALVMIGILAIGGSPTTPRPTTSAPSAGAAAVDPNQQRIEEYQRRIQEQAQRLTQEQAELARTKQGVTGTSDQVGSPARSGERLVGAPSSTSPPPTGMPLTSSTASLPHERARGDDRSLFADNVAFRRWSPASTNGIADEGKPPAALPTMDVRSVVRPAGESDGPSADRDPTRATGRASASASASERAYRLTEGTLIETVLTNRLDGTFAGPVNCLVTTAVYARDQQHLLIPAGSRVLGEAKPVNTFGQSRLAVVFHRLMLPNGTAVDLHDFHGLNQVGEVGLRDQVDRHYAQIFGASLAVGAIAGLAQVHTTVGLDATSLDVSRQGAASNLAQSSARILDRFLNILPTVTIREGHRIKVYLSNDLELPAYRDTLPGGRP